MKHFILVVLAAAISCNNNKKADPVSPEAGTQQTTDKSSFMSSCMIDASNPLRTPDEEDRDVPADEARVKTFCECAYEKTNGQYPGSIIADRSKLKKDPVLAPCWQAAHQ